MGRDDQLVAANEHYRSRSNRSTSFRLCASSTTSRWQPILSGGAHIGIAADRLRNCGLPRCNLVPVPKSLVQPVNEVYLWNVLLLFLEDDVPRQPAPNAQRLGSLQG